MKKQRASPPTPPHKHRRQKLKYGICLSLSSCGELGTFSWLIKRMPWTDGHHAPAPCQRRSTEGLCVSPALREGSLGKGEDVNYVSKSFHSKFKIII